MSIPEDFTEFLHWVKFTTEERWALGPPSYPAYSRGQHHESFWGATWVDGLTDQEIDALELKYGIKFPPDMRLFLQILHAIDRKDYYEDQDAEPGEEKLHASQQFYNWRSEHEALAERFKWPFDTILADAIGYNQTWLREWGPRPESIDDCGEVIRKWMEFAPPLIPIYGHRFLVAEPLEAGNPVLSVVGTDTIVYGWNLRYYLLNELHDDLGLYTYTLTKNGYDTEPIPEFAAIQAQERQARLRGHIPYWEDIILSSSTGWGSFGRTFNLRKETRNPESGEE